MKRLNNLIFSTITAGILIGCGGGGSAGSTTSSNGTSTPTITPTTATLIDNTISGVKYVNGSVVGFTDANGNFPYTNGLVEFYLGKIKLGELNSMTSDKKVFIQDLAGVDRSNTTDSNVLKIASLLQSLDSDSTTDEIEIKLEDFNKFNNISNSLDSINVSTLLSNNGFTIKSEDKIKEHLVNSQKQHNVIFDNTPPTLIGSSIINGQTNISKNSSIVLTFSEEIPKKYLTTEYFKLTNNLDNSIVETNIESNGKVIIITPNTELSYSQSYEFTISTTLKDFAGNFLSNEGGNNDILIEFLVENELDRTSPIINNFPLILVDENQITAFKIIATDNSSTLNYSLSGVDANYFNINPTTGEFLFKTLPDYETKNSYVIIANVKDASNNSTLKEITISINDVYEDNATNGNTSTDDYPNTLSDAQSITLNTSVIGDLELSDDVDYFKFTLTEKTTVEFERISIEGKIGQSNLANFDVFNSSGVNILNDYLSGSNEKQSLSLEAGTYYIKISTALNDMTGCLF